MPLRALNETFDKARIGMAKVGSFERSAAVTTMSAIPMSFFSTALVFFSLVGIVAISCDGPSSVLHGPTPSFWMWRRRPFRTRPSDRSCGVPQSYDSREISSSYGLISVTWAQEPRLVRQGDRFLLDRPSRLRLRPARPPSL